MDDTRILLEEQNEKNDLLERKFRKVDAELMEASILLFARLQIFNVNIERFYVRQYYNQRKWKQGECKTCTNIGQC